MVDEMYLSQGVKEYPKFLIMLMADGSLKANWYNGGSIKVELERPSLKRVKNGMAFEYGKVGFNGKRPSIELLDYESGELTKQWVRIK